LEVELVLACGDGVEIQGEHIFRCEGGFVNGLFDLAVSGGLLPGLLQIFGSGADLLHIFAGLVAGQRGVVVRFSLRGGLEHQPVGNWLLQLVLLAVEGEESFGVVLGEAVLHFIIILRI
jgi:hypothetical protein